MMATAWKKYFNCGVDKTSNKMKSLKNSRREWIRDSLLRCKHWKIRLKISVSIEKRNMLQQKPVKKGHNFG